MVREASGGFNNSDTARALTLYPYRERLVLQVLGVMSCACYKVTAAVSAVRNIHDVVLETQVERPHAEPSASRRL